MPDLLVVEDDPDFRGMLVRVFETNGFRVLGARTAREGLKALGGRSFDAVILDIGLPGCTGTEFLRIVRRDLKNARIPVVVLTARDDFSSKEETLAAGADDYLVKPCDLKELTTRVLQRIERDAALADLCPLTELPGNKAIYREITRRMSDGRSIVVGYSDLKNFKAVNDAFGACCGDEIIRDNARTLQYCVEDYQGADGFVGHIGGDDFVFMVGAECAGRVADSIVSTYDIRVAEYFRVFGPFQTLPQLSDVRGGRKVLPPYLTIHIGMVSSSVRTYPDAADVMGEACLLKEEAKKTAGSSWRCNWDGMEARRSEKAFPCSVGLREFAGDRMAPQSMGAPAWGRTASHGAPKGELK